MYSIFGHLKLTPKQKGILDKCKTSNSREYHKWFFHNTIYPVGLMFATVLLVAIVKKDSNEVINTTFSGGFSILGINVLYAMSSYLIRSKFIEKDKLKDEVVNLAEKLSDYKTGLIVLGSGLYFLQVAFLPQSGFWLFVLFVSTAVILFISLRIAVMMFVIRDDFYVKAYTDEDDSFDKKIRKESAKIHGKNWEDE